MKLRILTVPDCPNLLVLQQHLAEAVAGRDDVTITTEVVDTAERAARVGMNGSPTLLVDGVDPFVQPGQVPSLSCRLYRDGVPSVAELRAAVLAWRARTAPAEPAERALLQAILRAFAATGRPPSEAELQRSAPVLARLHDADAIRLDPDGAIRVAYPFSAIPTRHRVRLASGVEVWAMCAIDALGIPAMLDTDATITCADPVTGADVAIDVHNGQYAWNPDTAVVFSSAATGTGPSADVCCNDLNAFTSSATARIWMREHPCTPGELLDAVTAERCGRHIFGTLLDPADDCRKS
ncbi:alkylmercury lyase family protein [Allokutzneria sp. A3M-2-11 16]|uniref:alkylmercury lyase family protein n=1 Tax=Allokutzneria sp. A3M-2-11 16 TaxID=2962043 RepID=UPI0020B7721C|nr:organomercurial lyase [Allokutzneria sp. A3M-2-11 16]MCP3805513.1 alkylmercury lyase family protein [Allokutzneria sp. A3M-2-11 16]